MKNHQIWYESSLKLQSSLFDWFWIGEWSNSTWIQGGALELIIWLILHWKTINFDMSPAWSFRAHYLIDFQLRNHQIWYESRLKLQSSLFDWFFIEKWSNVKWIQPEPLELFIWLILIQKWIKFEMIKSYHANQIMVQWEFVQILSYWPMKKFVEKKWQTYQINENVDPRGAACLDIHENHHRCWSRPWTFMLNHQDPLKIIKDIESSKFIDDLKTIWACWS